MTVAVVCTTSRPTSRLSSREHLRAFLRGGFARLDDDLFGGGDGLLRFLLAHAGGGLPRLVNQLVRLVAGVGQNFLAFGLGVRHVRLDFFRVGERLGDFLPARLAAC